MGEKMDGTGESFVSSTEEVKETLAADVAAEQGSIHDRLYRPSNGTEGESFQCAFCERCTKDDPEVDICCDILTRTAAFGIEDPEYPQEWCYGDAGQPVCTAFEERDFVAEEQAADRSDSSSETVFSPDSDTLPLPYVTRDPDKISSAFIRNLPVPVPDEELAELAKRMSHTHGVWCKAKLDAKAAAKGYKGITDRAEEEMVELAGVIEAGTEERPVSCRWEFDYSAGVKKLRRLDNHQIVDEETLQGDELHLSFDFQKSEENVAKFFEGREPAETAANSQDPSIVDINSDQETEPLTQEEIDRINSEVAAGGATQGNHVVDVNNMVESGTEPKEKGPHACKVCGFDADSHIYLVRHLRDIHGLKLSEYKAQYPVEK